ncbi:DoxX family protein [Actinokineospora sp.]|uniref:DoxX family protein n=1 Tax=Actinokineospora sp. TaxID=1872133 RepID=UPI0040379B90
MSEKSNLSRVAAAFFRDRVSGRAAVATAVLRIVTGLFFVLAAIPKFAAHDFELAEFARFGLPESSALVYLVGLLELGGGLMLVLGVGTRLAALGLAVNMAGAIATAGVKVGGPFHLGVAPALLLAMVFLLWAGPGVAALDRRLAAGIG